VNQAPGKIIVTVLNNFGSDWSGTIAVDHPDAVTGVLEYISDQRVEFAASPAGLTIPAHVAAYGVRVFGIESGGAALAKSPSREKPELPLVRNQVPAGKAARSTRFH